MKIQRPVMVGQVRVGVKEVLAKDNGRGWGYGNCRTFTVYETTAEEAFEVVKAALISRAEEHL